MEWEGTYSVTVEPPTGRAELGSILQGRSRLVVVLCSRTTVNQTEDS